MATTTERADRVSTTHVGQSAQRWIPWMVGAVAVALVAVAGYVVWDGGQVAPEAVPVHPELVRQQAMSDAELRQELIERGAIPSGTAALSSELLRQQAMSDAELRQELIERGLVPGSAVAVDSALLRQQAMTDAELRQELIDKGLIPSGAVPQATSGADMPRGITQTLTNVREAP